MKNETYIFLAYILKILVRSNRNIIYKLRIVIFTEKLNQP